MKLVLIRHGESEYNKQDLATGLLNPPLTILGMKQAVACGKLLSNTKFDSVYTSVLDRATHTADLIIQQNQFNSKDIIRSSSLNEKADGILEGNKRQQLISTLGDKWDLWKRTIDHSAPGGETVNEIYKRVNDFYDTITPVDNILIVSHQYPIRCLLIRFKELSINDIFDLEVNNAFPYIIEI